MPVFDEINQRVGLHKERIQYDARQIEVAVSIPENCDTRFVAFVAHPHPLLEGTMDNKVVTTTAKAFLGHHIPVIRFNFRGVGHSTGDFSQGIGETDDLLFLIDSWLKSYPKAEVILAGFSFGSYVVHRAAQMSHPKLLILIAPAVEKFSYATENLHKIPDMILQGDIDEVVDPKAVSAFAQSFHPPIPMHWFEETGHFFHGRLIQLREVVGNLVDICLPQI